MNSKNLIKNTAAVLTVLFLVSCTTVKKENTVVSTPKTPAVNPAIEKSKIISQLKKYQELYLKQDDFSLSQLMKLYSSDKNVEVIFGCAEKPGTVGWCRGIPQIKEMIIKDSECWKTIDFNFKDTLVTLDNNTAWVSTLGNSELTSNYLKKFEIFTKNLTKSIEGESQHDDAITPTILKLMVDILYVKNKAGKLELPFVLTLIFTKENDNWLIRQMHFSYPIDPRGMDYISKIKAI